MTPTLLRVREKVIASVPEIKGTESKRDGHRIISREKVREITLADVLRTLDNTVMRKDSYRINNGLLDRWNLSLPLDEQSPETIAFLDSILNTMV